MQPFLQKKSAFHTGTVTAVRILPEFNRDLVKYIIIIVVEMSQRSALLVESKLLFLNLQVLRIESRKKKEEKAK